MGIQQYSFFFISALFHDLCSSCFDLGFFSLAVDDGCLIFAYSNHSCATQELAKLGINANTLKSRIRAEIAYQLPGLRRGCE